MSKNSVLKRYLISTYTSLSETHLKDLFFPFLLFSTLLFLLGIYFSIRIQNLYLAFPLSLMAFSLPWFFLQFAKGRYERILAQDLEDGLTQVTQSYMRTLSLEESIDETMQVLPKYTKRAMMTYKNTLARISPDKSLAIREMKKLYTDDVYLAFCDTCLLSEQDHKKIWELPTLLKKYKTRRLLYTESAPKQKEAITEYFAVLALTILNYPLIYFMNRDWFSILLHTSIGKLSVAFSMLLILITSFLLVTWQTRFQSPKRKEKLS